MLLQRGDFGLVDTFDCFDVFRVICIAATCVENGFE